MRKLLAMTAFLCLLAAGTAYATVSAPPNTYGGSYTVVGAKGSGNKPVPVAMVEKLVMGSTTSGNVGAPLTEINSTVAGLKSYAGYFPKCTAGTINTENGHNGKWNAVCPKRALVASGTTTAALVSSSGNLQGPGAPCFLHLWVYNGGAGKVTYFFTIANPTDCDGLTTGAAIAWTGSIKQAGSKLVNDVPEPPDVSTNAGNLNSLFGSLESETLNWKKVTAQHAGRTYGYLMSTGCKGSRAFSIKYTATTSLSPSPANESSGTVKGSGKC
jgi:hypothetical protein